MKRRMRFVTWCKKEPDDETKIVYTFKTYDGRTLFFTSEDEISWSWLERIRNAWVEKIERVQNEFSDHWHAVLYEDEK